MHRYFFVFLFLGQVLEFGWITFDQMFGVGVWLRYVRYVAPELDVRLEVCWCNSSDFGRLVRWISVDFEQKKNF